LWAEVLIEDLDFLAELEVLALLEIARDFGDDRAARGFLDLEVIFAIK
jgi:hypothetical protein